MMGDLSNTATDIVGGLRVLRGIGGEQVFLDRYRRESQSARRAGVAVARLQSVLDALQVFLPGVFVVVVVWLGARYAVEGRISPGELVAFYGYAAFLMIPLRTATEYANKLIRALSPRAACAGVLALEPEVVDPSAPPRAAAGTPSSPTPAAACGSARAASPRWSPSRPTRRPRLADRLGLCAPGADDEVTLGGVPLTALPRAEVRRRIVVSDTGSALFSGPLARAARRHRAAGGEPSSGPGDRVGRRHPRCAPRRARHRRHRARPHLLRRPAPAAGARACADRRPRGAGPGRADVGGRRPHRGPHRRAAARPPRRTHHRRHHDQPAAPRPRSTQVAFLRDGPSSRPAGTHADLLRDEPAYRAVVTRETEQAVSAP